MFFPTTTRSILWEAQNIGFHHNRPNLARAMLSAATNVLPDHSVIERSKPIERYWQMRPSLFAFFFIELYILSICSLEATITASYIPFFFFVRLGFQTICSKPDIIILNFEQTETAIYSEHSKVMFMHRFCWQNYYELSRKYFPYMMVKNHTLMI